MFVFRREEYLDNAIMPVSHPRNFFKSKEFLKQSLSLSVSLFFQCVQFALQQELFERNKNRFLETLVFSFSLSHTYFFLYPPKL